MDPDSSAQITVKSSAPVVVCNTCGNTFYLLPNTEIAGNEELTSFGIVVNEQQAYCLLCLEDLLQKEKRQAQMLEERYIYHKEFESSYEESEMRDKTLHHQPSQHQQLVQEISKLHKEQTELDAHLTRLREETNQLKDKIFSFEVEEEKFWQGINKIERRTNKVEQKSLNTKFDKNEEKDVLEELSKISIIHMFSDIVVEDNVAFVQGMAMGKRGEGIDISWEEVSVGLAHLLITLNFLAMKYTYPYKLIDQVRIKGVQSQIVLHNKKRRLPVGNLKQNQKQIGELLQVLLIETAHLSEYILQAQNVSYSEQFRIPFLINTNQFKIAQLFIDPFKMDERIRWNSWTKAMRYFLINFKHMITVYAINDKYL